MSRGLDYLYPGSREGLRPALVALGFVVVLGMALLTLHLAGWVADGRSSSVTSSTVCTEDMACFDPCSMGNGFSGPDGPCPKVGR